MRTVLRATIVGLVWAAAVAAAVVAIDHGQTQARDDLVARFDDRAHTSAAFVSAYVAAVFASERELAATLPPGGGSPAAFEEDVRLSGFTAAVLLDGTGRVMASSPAGTALPGVDLAAQYPHLASALSGEPAVTGVVLSAVNDTPIAAFAIPIGGGKEGVLSVEYSFDESPLATFLGANTIPGSRGYIIDADGLPGVYAGDGATPAVDGIDADLRLDGPVVVDGRVGVVAPIAGTPWRLMLTAPLAAVVAPATRSDWVDWTIVIAGALATLVGLVVLGWVGASRRRSRKAQAESEQQFRLTVDNAPIGMSLVALDGQFLEPNAQLCTMLGYSHDELIERRFQDITHPDDLDANRILNEKLMSGQIAHYEMEKRYIRGDGDPVWARLSVSLVRDPKGRPLHFVSQVEDVTEVRAAQAQLERRALYDPLTGLANRGLLIDRLSHALAEHRRDPGWVAVAYCDLDHFKRVNDSLGHHAGDLVLQEVARRLQSVVRAGDTVARMGGDEFVLILPRAASLEVVQDILDRAKQVVAHILEVDGHSLTVSFSAGLALGGSDTSAETLLRDADVALYAAKEGGRSRAEVFTAAMRSRAVEYQAIEEELRQGIELDQFELHYQPIVTLRDRQTVAFEALLRWRHPERGLLLPAAFLDVAVESHLIVPIGQRVLRQACQFVARHPHGTWRVFVNIAPVQLGRDLDGVVASELAAAGVPATRLGLEITENGVLEAAGSSLTEMQRLRDMGVELLMDDFGTGYSALSSILTTPITGIKLDRSFTSQLGKDEAADRITATVANLVDSLGAHGVVEGIETEDQYTRALAHGWVHGQGYLFGRPAPESALTVPRAGTRSAAAATASSRARMS